MIPDSGLLRARLEAACAALDSEELRIRPADSSGRPGGLVILPELPTILVPDLHARGDFLAAILGWAPPGTAGEAAADRTTPAARAPAPNVGDLLARGKINLVCLGDGINTEGSPEAARRWRAALGEYFSGWRERRAMDEEMGLALGAMLQVMEFKADYPRNFHFLKGNHDNLADRADHGDRHFFKYASESAMGASWFESTYGADLLESWRGFELSLPLVALRPGSAAAFAASHAEPATCLTREDIIEYRNHPDTVYALTWTGNDEALPSSVRASLDKLLSQVPGPRLWFSGHRPVQDLIRLRADGLLVQFHNPHYAQFAFLEPTRPFDPERDIVRLFGVFH